MVDRRAEIHMRWGYTADRTEVATWAICRATGGKFSHCFPVFYVNGSPMYFESISKKDRTTKKTGARGPMELDNVTDWWRDKPLSRSFKLQPETGYLPFATDECWDAYDTAARAVRSVHYAHLQIMGNWITQRTGLRFACKWGSRFRWTCSEFCMLLVPARYLDYFSMRRLTVDDIVPSGTKLMSIESGTDAMLREEGALLDDS